MSRILKLLPILFICVVLVSCKGMVKKEEAAATASDTMTESAPTVAAVDPEALLEEDIRAMVEDEGPLAASTQLPSSPSELSDKADKGRKALHGAL